MESKIIINTVTHPNDSSIKTITTNRYKANGYYGVRFGIHSIQYNLLNFVGNIIVQGALELSPTEDDWFDIEETLYETSVETTINTIKNFTGNFVYIRTVVNYYNGTIRSVVFNNMSEQ